MDIRGKRMLITLKNGDKYMIEKDHNDDMYEIRSNHLYMKSYERRGFFVFKRWVDVEIDLGEIKSTEAKE